MAWKRTTRIVGLFVVGSLLVVGTGMAYRAIIAPWRGDVREPLIAAFFVGVVYFVSCMVGLRWTERREQLARREQEK